MFSSKFLYISFFQDLISLQLFAEIGKHKPLEELIIPELNLFLYFLSGSSPRLASSIEPPCFPNPGIKKGA